MFHPIENRNDIHDRWWYTRKKAFLAELYLMKLAER